MDQAKDIEKDYEEDDKEDDEEDEEGDEENITLQCDQNFSDVELLDILKTASSKETKESDVNKFGSVKTKNEPYTWNCAAQDKL